MRDLFDRRLTDPTVADVVEAIRAAEAAANAGHKSGNLVCSGSSAQPIAARVLAEPEGMNGHFGTANQPANIGRLSLGWWTNSAGRKLVRVRSWREWSDRYAEFGFQTQEFTQSESDRHRRPGVWHVDHERVVEASSGGEPEWVAVCGCGAAGSPASLGWQHGMCGPCADRVAEFGPDSVKHAPGLLADADFVPTEVLFTPDGKFLVVAGGHAYRVWDVATGTLRVGNNCSELMPEVRPAATTDGRFIILSRYDVASLLIDLTGSPSETRLDINEFQAAYATGRSGEFLVQRPGRDRLKLVDVTDGRAPLDLVPPESTARLDAVWPDANAPRAVFTTAGHRASLANVERDGTLTVLSRFNLGEGRLNRTGLWQGGPTRVRFTPDGERLLFIRGAEMELRHPDRLKALLQAAFPQPILDAAFSPDYEHLFILGADGTLYVCNPGSLTGVRAKFRWHLGPVSRLAVSPDGQTLATAGAEGVKLWPISQLLPLLE